ncbi:MAG: peptidylprolyl isomerase [Chloroflexi bacterium]|nr:peptidylprolyl isomerase [Chloroflexota bacterium]
MKKHFLPIILLALLLAACGSASQSPIATPTTMPTPAPTQPVCRAIFQPTPAAGVNSLFPGVRAGEWTKGPADAAATIIVYNDFQCVECNDRVLGQVIEKHPNDVRLVYRHYPQLDRYDKSMLAAQASEAAGKQNKFWEMHDLLFAKQLDWVALTPEDFTAWALNEAEGLGLDRVQFETALLEAATRSKVQSAEAEARMAGITVLPLVIINGEIYYGPKDFSAFDQMVSLLALGKRQFSSCPEVTIDPSKQYLATLKTVKGDIVIQLYADKAPMTVNSFIFLARNGWYDGVTFHRVIPDFVAQAGDPSGTGAGGPGYLYRNEFVPSLHFDKPGVVAMANSGVDTNGSQFFITFAAQPSLDGLYTIFGHVISGMDVLEKLTPRDPRVDAVLPDGDLIISVTIEER